MLSCESTADLSREHLARRNIPRISCPFQLNRKTYQDNLGRTVSCLRFYAAMAAGGSQAGARGRKLRRLKPPAWAAQCAG